MPTGSQQTTESETPVPAATDTADPLLYPSWYKGQTRKSTANPPSAPGSGSLVGPSGSKDAHARKAEGAEAAARERAAVRKQLFKKVDTLLTGEEHRSLNIQA